MTKIPLPTNIFPNTPHTFFPLFPHSNLHHTLQPTYLLLPSSSLLPATVAAAAAAVAPSIVALFRTAVHSTLRRSLHPPLFPLQAPKHTYNCDVNVCLTVTSTYV